jgi:tetratricopeptide (TPR) repeat protein
MPFVSLQSVLDEARWALRNGAMDRAMSRLQHILVYFPHCLEGHRLLGEAYLHVAQPEQAVPMFEHVLHVDPEHVAAYYGLGLARSGLNQEPEAIAMFEHVLEIQPNLTELRTQIRHFYAKSMGSRSQFRLTRAGLGRLYARSCLFEQAISEFRAAFKAEPARIDIQVALAEALWRANQNDEAVELCRELLAQRPELLKPSLLLSFMLIMDGQQEGATLWRRAATYDPTLTMARALFEELPSLLVEDPKLPPLEAATERTESATSVGEAQLGSERAVSTSSEAFTLDGWDLAEVPYGWDAPSEITSPNNLSAVYAQLDADPQNAALRLAIARMSWEAGDSVQSLKHYKQLIKQEMLLEEVVGDLHDAIADAKEPGQLRKLHRLLGDAYMKQQRLREAMEAYSWTPD